MWATCIVSKLLFEAHALVGVIIVGAKPLLMFLKSFYPMINANLKIGTNKRSSFSIYL
jgi:hypothetical protein